jgi:hypothetical protein
MATLSIELTDRIDLIRSDVAVIDAALVGPEIGSPIDTRAVTGLRCLCERIMDELARLTDESNGAE